MSSSGESSARQAEKSRRELRSNMIASFATGVTIISFTNPMDTLKCRWQVGATNMQINRVTLFSFARQVIVNEGLWTGLWRPGLPPNMLAMGIAIGFRNGLYPTVRDTLGYAIGGPSRQVGATGMFASGLLAGMCGYFVASPLLQVKTQMQAEAGLIGANGCYETGVRAGSKPTYGSTYDAFRVIWSSGAAENSNSSLGGLRALWRGAGVIVGRGAVLSASQLSAYDSTKKHLRTYLEDGPSVHVAASLVAAAVCTTCAMPLDVVLTVYQSAHSLGGDRLERFGRRGPLACAGAMLRESGPQIFMSGWVPAFMRLAPTCVASFWLYEQLRKLVGIGYLD